MLTVYRLVYLGHGLFCRGGANVLQSPFFCPFRYNVGVTVREVYDDNINISSFQRISDTYTVIEPGIHLGFGDSAGGFNYLTFDYIASVYSFAARSATPCTIMKL